MVNRTGKYEVKSSFTNEGFDRTPEDNRSISEFSEQLRYRPRTLDDEEAVASKACDNKLSSPVTSKPKLPLTNMLAAVTASQVVKGYGTGNPILNNFTMNVPKGTIYSLLGSSGCGKTTLLSCVVGLKQIQSGEILVFGATPGSKASGVPGKRVGYMPQDISLYNDFSIAESLQYFGALYGMKSSEVLSRQEFLVKCLDLPDPDQPVGTLSGGQKRRVSLAVTLIHLPDLLILDEPTVGVDPLLRESIWNYLSHLVKTRNTSVIITTHYIEEARQSNFVGLMRGGRLIAEKSPEALLKEYNTDLLQDIVLKLCKNDKLGNQVQELSKAVAENIKDTTQADDENAAEKHFISPRGRMPSLILETLEDQNTLADIGNRIRALIQKNVTVIMRNYILALFLIILPAFQTTVICLALGGDPRSLKFGVVNMESQCSTPKMRLSGCDMENLSCKFIKNLPNETILLRNYASVESARDAVKNGQAWGFMLFPEGFSGHLYTRFSSGNIVDNETLDKSQIYLEMDFSNKQVGGTLQRLVYEGYKDFIRDILGECGFHPEIGEPPIKTPIYGTDDTDFRLFLAPSFLVAAGIFFPMVSSGMSLIWDKKQGTMERALVAGVKTWEIMAAFLVTEGAIVLIQQVVCFFILSFCFGITVYGSLFTASAILTLVGATGLSLGYLVASICKEEIEAALFCLAIYFPNCFLSGLLWPTQALPINLKYISYALPTTLPAEAFRSVVNRGWDFSHPNVWPAFPVSFTWIVMSWLLTILVHKTILLRK